MDIYQYTQGIIDPENAELRKSIQARLDDLTKPPGSLGRLEELVMSYCLCKRNAGADIKQMALFTFAGDHGITEEGVTPFPKEVTRQMVLNMAAGGAAISVLCRNAGIKSAVVDMGVDGDFDSVDGLIDRKISRGTANFASGKGAMTEEQARKAMDAGYELGMTGKADLYGIGEMGIGNTSSASALYSLFLDLPAEQTVGPGTGASGELLTHKKQVIDRAVAAHRKEWDGTGFDGLRRLGGFEIAGMTGFIFGAASKGIQTVVDGFISGAAALCAMRIFPGIKPYLVFSHESAETFHRGFLARLNLTPVLILNMRLGEGTGAALAMQIIKQAMNCYHQMATFSSAGVSNKT